MFDTGLSPQTAFWLWAKSDTIGDAVDRIAESISQIRPVLKDKKTNEYIKEHPALDLLDNPGMTTSSGRLKRELATSLLLTSECYPVLTGNINYEPSGMYQVYANNVSDIEGDNGYINHLLFSAKYDMNSYYRQDDYKRELFVYRRRDDLAETQMIKSVSQSYGNRGQSVLERIYYQAMTKYYGNIHNTGLLKNASRPSGAISPKNERLTKEQHENFKEEVNEKLIGAVNAGQMIIAPTPISYENFIMNPRDMDFINLIENSRVEIYGQYKIPLPLVVTKTMTMNNYENSVYSFYDFAVIPKANYLFNEIGRFILPRYKDGDRFRMTIDEKDLSALKGRMIERGKAMAGTYVYSDNEIRSETGYEEREGGDDIMKPATLIPSGIDQYTDDNIKK
jgi:HK97 family phage portal protein